jgi:hypothetical protein
VPLREGGAHGVDPLPFAIEVVGRDETLDDTDPGGGLLVDPPGVLDPIRPHEIGNDLLAALDEGEHETGVLPGGTVSDAGSLEEQDSMLGEALRQVKRGGEAGEAPADDDHVRLLVAAKGGQRRSVAAGGFEPVAVGLEG